MYFQMDDTGDKGNGIKSFPDACAAAGLAPVPAITDQIQAGYCFEMHTGTHGSRGIYVNKSNKGDRIKNNVPEILIGPPASWLRGSDSFKSKESKDALLAVSNNTAALTALWDAFNT